MNEIEGYLRLDRVHGQRVYTAISFQTFSGINQRQRPKGNQLNGKLKREGTGMNG
ncbi:hypothetical protein [Methanosarcina sp.]|uniref:hypothetical protein n=1 Tax=Methanosarcina sp. TaxID=2213 RepID=UPI002ABC67BF|nr:hypothetical protein [Methanosarcina sp.]MDY9925746.1 hypothetical protein [Methanosarcina sp.]